MKDRSCRICGFFVDNETLSAGNIGYCLYAEESGDTQGESLKIPDGEEKKIALDCKSYFRKVKGLSTGEFLSWRMGIINSAKIQKRITFLTIVISLASLIIAASQLIK